MALGAKAMHIPAGLGIDEATKKEILEVGQANRSNVNCRVTEKGALEKRLGFRTLSKHRFYETDGFAERSTGRRVLSHKGVLTVIDDTHLDSYIEGAGRNAVRSRMPPCSYRLIDSPTPSAGAQLWDIAYANGFVCVASNTSLVGTPKVAIQEAETGAVIQPPQTIVGANGYILVASFSDRYFMTFHVNVSTSAITAHFLDTQDSDLTWFAIGEIAPTSTLTISVASLSDRAVIAYGDIGGTNRVIVRSFDETGLLAAAAINTASVTPVSVDVDGPDAGGTLWVAWSASTSGHVVGLNPTTLAVTVADGVILTMTTACNGMRICAGAANEARVFAIDTATPYRIEHASVSVVAATATLDGAQKRVYNVMPSSRPFYQDGRYYVAVFASPTSTATGGNTQGLCTIVDWSQQLTYLTPIAHLEPGLVSLANPLCKVPAISATKRLHGFQVVKSGGTSILAYVNGGVVNSILLTELDFASRHRWQNAEHANSTFFGGAMLSVLDGELVTESGILSSPTKPTGSLAGSGLTGTYRAVAIYEDVDAAGNWVVSGISLPSDVVNAADDTITWSTSPLTVTARAAKGTTRVAFYRTINGGEAPYYRLGATTISTASGTVTFSDAITDTTLAQAAKLYAPNLPGAASEAQDRRAPPGLQHLVSYNGMLVGAKGDTLFFSGQEVYGEAIWHSPIFQAQVSGGGDITAIKVQDGTLFVWKRDRIFGVTGEAPSDNGLQGGLGVPRLIATDVGTIEPDSLLVTSLGIFFQSSRGIEVLSRSQTVEWIGEPIQNTLAAYPIITSAVLDARNSLVRFSLAESEADGLVTGEGRTLIYDLSIKSWVSTDDQAGVSVHEASQSAALVHLDGQWRYVWLGTDGAVYAEKDPDDADAYLDAEFFVSMQYELPPWKLGLQQEQRIYEIELLFERFTDAGITVEIANDFGAYGVEPDKVWLVGDEAFADANEVSFRPHPQGNAVQLRVRDTAPLPYSNGLEFIIPDLGTGRGFALIGLSSDIAAKQGPTRATPRLNPVLRR